MIIGADVSHPAPGLEQASMAAMTVSLDRTCSRYGAAVQTNGKRVEMITGKNIREMMTPLFDWWIKNVGGGQLPKHVYYFRDGVSEGQYIPLLKYEVADIKETLSKLGNDIAERMVSIIIQMCVARMILTLNSPSSRLLWPRSVTTFASSLLKGQLLIDKAILFPVSLSIGTSRPPSRTTSTYAHTQRFKERLVPLIIQFSWMR